MKRMILIVIFLLSFTAMLFAEDVSTAQVLVTYDGISGDTIFAGFIAPETTVENFKPMAEKEKSDFELTFEDGAKPFYKGTIRVYWQIFSSKMLDVCIYQESAYMSYEGETLAWYLSEKDSTGGNAQYLTGNPMILFQHRLSNNRSVNLGYKDIDVYTESIVGHAVGTYAENLCLEVKVRE